MEEPHDRARAVAAGVRRKRGGSLRSEGRSCDPPIDGSTNWRRPPSLSAFVGNYAVASLSRLVALDAFRGATIALMIIVNNAGGPTSYGPLKHSAWNGWTMTDTVFPAFLWIVGVSITL